MDKEIVIGADVEPIFNSVAMWYNADVNENYAFYIFKSEIANFRIYVYKESEEGEEIKEWLSHDKNLNNNSVQRKALELLLPRLTVDDFFEIIEKEKNISWDKGYKKAQYDIRRAIGLDK